MTVRQLHFRKHAMRSPAGPYPAACRLQCREVTECRHQSRTLRGHAKNASTVHGVLETLHAQLDNFGVVSRLSGH